MLPLERRGPCPIHGKVEVARSRAVIGCLPPSISANQNAQLCVHFVHPDDWLAANVRIELLDQNGGGIDTTKTLREEKKQGAFEFQQQKKIVGGLLSIAKSVKCNCGHFVAIFLIQSSHSDPNFFAVVGDLEMLEKTVKSLQVIGVTDVKEALVDFKGAHKRTALHFAAAKGRRQVINYILERAPDCVEAVEEEGATPLLYAVKEN
uniref:Uncharacterized protein n=1 Tax=Peronospora matthiolae TaxID=2874970 RepID=A0AAV1VE66_9STRA